MLFTSRRHLSHYLKKNSDNSNVIVCTCIVMLINMCPTSMLDLLTVVCLLNVLNGSHPVPCFIPSQWTPNMSTNVRMADHVMHVLMWAFSSRLNLSLVFSRTMRTPQRHVVILLIHTNIPFADWGVGRPWLLMWHYYLMLLMCSDVILCSAILSTRTSFPNAVMISILGIHCPHCNPDKPDESHKLHSHERSA